MKTSKATILNVDDFEPGLYAKSRALRLAGFEVFEATTGEDAIQLANGLKPQLVLLDVRLPDVSGIEICRRIKTNPSTDSIMVIQTSATFTESHDRIRGLEGGADAYLTEPIEADELIANVRAILRLREAEQQVREREAWLKTVMSSIGDAVITTDLEGRVTLINLVAQKMTGWSEAEAEGRPLTEVFRVIDGQTRQPSESPVVRVLRGGPSAGLADQDVLTARDGRETPIDNRAAPIKDESGNVIGVVLTFRDVTELKRMEMAREQSLMYEQEARREAEEASRLKDEFLATVSHELRSPLNAILGYTQMLRSGPADRVAVDNATAVIERGAKSQLQIIEDLLDSARIIAGKLRIEPGTVDLVPALEAALDTVRPAAGAKGVTLVADFGPAPEQVLGDPTRLQQVVWNLLTNAVKFTPEGGRVELRLESDDDSDSVRITVSDTGKGIEPEFLPFVFDRFRQADPSGARRYGGLGLGLSLVKHLVEMHGGTITTVSEGAGRGATFTVTLPRRHLELIAATPAVAPREAGTEDFLGTGRKVSLEGVSAIVVDDQEDARESLVQTLSKYGARVTAVSSGEEALALLSDPPGGEWPDALILDIAMPDEDGYTTLKRVRALEAEQGRAADQIPAVALTACGRSEDRLCALQAGFQMHVAKPVEPVELAVVIASLTNRRD